MKIRLRTLFVALAGMAAVAALVAAKLKSLPPTQIPYEVAELENSLAEGKVVLVTVDADWAMNPTNRPRYMSSLVSTKANARDLVTMNADWTDPHQAVEELLNEHSITRIPALLVFSPHSPDSPKIFDSSAGDAEIVQAIQQSATRGVD